MDDLRESEWFEEVLRKIIREEVACYFSKSQEGNDEKSEYEGKNIEEIATQYIRDLGVPASVRGYNYIRTAICIAVENPKALECVTKEMYPEIARHYSTTSSRVERAIRHAIEIMCARGNMELFNRIFGYSVDENKGKPTNSEFIAMIADDIKIKFAR